MGHLHPIIETALAVRRMRPTGHQCFACGDTDLHPGDMAGAMFQPDHLARVTEYYGGPVCSECADHAIACTGCGEIMDAAEFHDVVGDPLCWGCHDA